MAVFSHPWSTISIVLIHLSNALKSMMTTKRSMYVLLKMYIMSWIGEEEKFLFQKKGKQCPGQ